MKSVAVQVEGSNAAESIASKAFDMHCPLMKTEGNQCGKNYWKELCKYRQTLPELKRTCYPKCKVSSMHNLLEITDDEKKDLGRRFLDKYEHGMTFRDIADSEDVSESTVSKYIRMILNKSPRSSKYSIKDGEIWLALKYEKGVSAMEISKLYKCSYSTVNKYIRIAQLARN